MSIIERARAALQLVQEGRQRLAEIADAVKDSAEALGTRDKEELDRILAQEKEESRAAHDRLDEALKAVEQRGTE